MSDDPARRSTSNSNARGGSAERRSRRQWLIREFPANVSVIEVQFDLHHSFRLRPTNRASEAEWLRQLQTESTRFVPLSGKDYRLLPACRCYRCGELLVEDEVSPDRWPVLGADGGTYRRGNIRPACLPCNTETGSAVGHARKAAKRSRLAKKARPVVD